VAAQSDILDPLLNISKVMSSLKAMTEPRGVSQVSKSVTRDDIRESNNLTSSEQSRLRESATIIGKVLKIGAFKEGPEAQRLGDLTPDKAKSIAPSAIKDKIQPASKEKTSSFLDNLMGLLGLGSLALLASKAKKWLIEKLAKFVFTPMKNLLKWVGGKLWGAIKWVGGKLWGAVKWVGGKIFSGVKWLGSKMYKWGASIVDKIKNTKFFKGLMGVLQSAKNGIKGLWDDALKAVSGFVDNLVSGITKLKDGALNLVKKIPGYDLLKKGLEKTAAAGKAVGGAVVKGAKAVASGAKTVAKMALGAGQSKIAKYLGDFLGKGAGTIGKALKSVPLLGGAIETALAYGDIKNLKKQYKEGAISLKDLEYSIGERVVTAITALGGAALGGVLGSVIGPVGTVIGAVGGDIIGRWAGKLFAENLLSPNTVRKLGSFFHKEEMQDFLVKNGNVYKFNNRDEVLGMKTGGAIDNLISGLTQGLARDNSIIRDASIAQVNRLDNLIHLMTEMLKKPNNQQSTTFFNSPNNFIPSTVSNFREQFSNQTQIA
jgi:hypothetical protein